MPARDYYLPQRGLVEQQGASLIEPPRVPRSRFTGQKQRLTTFNAGALVPFMVDEILPGDHMKYRVTTYVRMATPLFPIYSNQKLQTFFFFVPSRLLWTHWVNFMGEQANPTDSIAYTVPILTMATRTGANYDDIYDQMGIPNQNTGGAVYKPIALPFRAYNRIWNEWFRDQNLSNSLVLDVSDGPDTTAYAIQSVMKMHDYFTSCLPWPQKFTAPTIPLGGSAIVRGLATLTQVTSAGFTGWETSGAITYTNSQTSIGAGEVFGIQMQPVGGGAYIPAVTADLSTATGVTINAFRQAFMIQTLLERDARGGTRYIESIKAQFGVVNPDFRLQRSEYIGGGQTPLMTTPVAQTAPSTGATVGALGAATTGAGQHNASYAATEHGYILGLMCARTEQIYQQGLHKMWTRQTRYDFFTPALDQLGEQAVYNQEIYADGTTNDQAVFGYQERWHEYRTLYSDTASFFRSTTTTPLDAWHLGQKYASAPALGQTFLSESPPMSRILAAGTNANDAQYLADILIQREAVRPISAYGTPAVLGRF